MANVMKLVDREERDKEFIFHFVENGGNATEAARAIGVSEASASTTGHRMKERLYKEIVVYASEEVQAYAPQALHGILYLCEHAESESVKLKAAQDILDRAGLKPIDRRVVNNINADLKDMSLEEINAELEELNHSWLDTYLSENNLKLTDLSDDEASEIAEIEHEMKKDKGELDH